MKILKRVLVLAPHTDDGELGCGGSIARMIEEGAEVYYVAFSTAKESVPKGLPENILEIEVKEATGRLNIPRENLIIYGFTVRKLSYSRQEILEELVKLKTDIEPDLVMLPSVNDLHQDHYTVAMEGLRAFKKTSMFSYEVPWNHIDFSTQAFIRLEKRHIEQKIYAIDAYNSQKMRDYAKPEFLWGLAHTRGVQVGTSYAETFEVVRWVL
jgi:N-acetylglucosamine malate deacetylase 1